MPTGLLAILVVLASCGGVHQVMGALQDLQKVQAELAKTLGSNEISINLLNGSVLSIAVVNSPWKDLPAAEKKAKALAIARLAYSSFPSRSALTAVSVSFAIHQTYLGIFNYNDSRDSFGFGIAQLTAESPTSNSIAVH
jgi:hypothetical protein